MVKKELKSSIGVDTNIVIIFIIHCVNKPLMFSIRENLHMQPGCCGLNFAY